MVAQIMGNKMQSVSGDILKIGTIGFSDGLDVNI